MREKKIVKVSILGIIVNLFLVLFKMIIGILANSIAVILDAINNLTDSFSAIITIIGTKLACKNPDREHPYGHGRIEYIASVIVSLIVMGAGFGALKESFFKILNPVTAKYSYISIIVIVMSIFVKFFLGKYVKDKGEELDSSSLIATGVDAYMDSVLSFGTLVAALVSMFFHISIEGYIGLIISIIIIKSSIDILKDTINYMIGIRADSKMTNNLKEIIKAYPDVNDVHDLIVHSYGPSRVMASINIEVRDDMTAREIHALTRKIIIDVYNKLEIFLTIGIYASNNSGINKEVKEKLNKIIKKYKDVKQLHAFYVDEVLKTISFDLIIDFDGEEPLKIKDEIIKELNKYYPEYLCIVIIDIDVSD